MTYILTICILTPILAILCWKDCKYRLLPNTYTVSLMIMGIIWRFVFGGTSGVIDGVLGGVACAAFLFIPFLLKGAGGGDLKMIFAVGIFTGFRYCCAELLFISLTGLLLGIVMLIGNKVDGQRLKHYLRSIFDWRYDRKAGKKSLPENVSEKDKIPFGVAIAVGTIITLLYAYFGEKHL